MNARTSFIRTLACAMALGGAVSACGMDSSDGSPSGAGLDVDRHHKLALETNRMAPDDSEKVLAAGCGPSAPPDGATVWQHDFGSVGSPFPPSSAALDREGHVFHASGATGVAKLDADGTAIWRVPLGSVVAADALGNAYVGSAPSDSAGANVTKLDASGATIWSRDIGSAAPQSIAATAEGGVLVSGDTLGTIRLDAAGHVEWTKSFGGNVASTSEDKVLITGSFDGTVDFGGGPVFGNHIDAFIVKLDNQGVYQWAQILTDATLPIARPGSGGGSVTQPSAQLGKRIAEAPNGDVLVAGFTDSSIKLFGQDLAAPVSREAGVLPLIYVARLDRNGEVLWKTSSSAFRDVRGLAADKDGNVIVSGGIVGNTRPFVYTWISKYNPSGTAIWTRAQQFLAGGGYVNEVATDSCGNIFAAVVATDTPGARGIPHGLVVKLRP